MITSTCPRCGMIYQANRPVQCPCVAPQVIINVPAQTSVPVPPLEPANVPLHWPYDAIGNFAYPYPLIKYETS